MTVIKRYSNRKLYDTQAKRYITLEGIADLIREGAEIQVLDHDTGEDITASIQAQVIFELERKLGTGLPRSLFSGLIQASNETIGRLRVALKPSDWEAQINAEIERRIQRLVRQGELDAAAGQTLQERLGRVGAPPAPAEPVTEADLERALLARGLPTRHDLEQLERQVDALAIQLDRLTRRPKK